MSEDENKLLPQLPVLDEYNAVKTELEAKIEKLNSITELTEENKKEVKTGIAEINKVKERISRYRINETNKFMEYIKPYVDKCKELEKLCDTGLADIKQKVKDLENAEKALKQKTVAQAFELFMATKDYSNFLKFEMFFDEKMCNKTVSLNVIQNQLETWYNQRKADIDFIKKQVDDCDKVISIYLNNGLNLTQAIETYQSQIKSEAEIAAAMASEQAIATVSFEKKIDIVVKIKQLPKSKGAALEQFLNSLGVEFTVEVVK